MRRLFAAFALLVVLGVVAACSDKEQAPAPVRATSTTQEASVTTPAGPSSGVPTRTSPSPTTTQPTIGPAEFQGSRAMEHIRQLTVAIGPRVSGSEGERRGAEYIRAQFAASGYVVEVVEFTFDGDPFRAATVAAGGKTYDALGMSGGEGGIVRGGAVSVGLADADGIAGRDLTGKVAIADRGTLQFRQKADNVRKAGATALIVVNDREGELSGTVGAVGIAVVGVTREAGVLLRQLSADGGVVSVTVPTGTQAKGLNVVAKSTAADVCQVVVGGHQDTVPGSPGAHDNGSGAAQVIELARAFAADGLDKGLCFVAFGGEESGLHGSDVIARDLKAKGQLPRVMVNIDASGVGRTVELIGDGELTRQALAVAQQMGIAAAVTELGAGFGSDHQSFKAVGVPVLYFASDELGKFHTPGDTIDTINPDLVEAGGDLQYAVIKQLLKQFASP